MSNLNPSVSNPSAQPTAQIAQPRRGGPKGPRVIKTLAQVQASAANAAIVLEMHKIENKLVRLEKTKKIAHQAAIDAQIAIENLLRIRATFLASTGVKTA